MPKPSEASGSSSGSSKSSASAPDAVFVPWEPNRVLDIERALADQRRSNERQAAAGPTETSTPKKLSTFVDNKRLDSPSSSNPRLSLVRENSPLSDADFHDAHGASYELAGQKTPEEVDAAVRELQLKKQEAERIAEEERILREAEKKRKERQKEELRKAREAAALNKATTRSEWSKQLQEEEQQRKSRGSSATSSRIQSRTGSSSSLVDDAFVLPEAPTSTQQQQIQSNVFSQLQAQGGKQPPPSTSQQQQPPSSSAAATVTSSGSAVVTKLTTTTVSQKRPSVSTTTTVTTPSSGTVVSSSSSGSTTTTPSSSSGPIVSPTVVTTTSSVTTNPHARFFSSLRIMTNPTPDERLLDVKLKWLQKAVDSFQALEDEAVVNLSGQGKEVRALKAMIPKIDSNYAELNKIIDAIKCSDKYVNDTTYANLIDARVEKVDKQACDIRAAYETAAIKTFKELNIDDPLVRQAPAAGQAGAAAAAAADFGQNFAKALQDASGNGYLGLPIPALKWDKFSGADITQYPNFIKKFKEVVQKRGIADEYKFEWLMDTLSGAAKNLVAGRANTDNRYQLTLNDLEREYGGKDIQISAHYAKLRARKRLNDGASANDMRELYTFLNDTFTALKDFGAILDPTICLAEVEDKLNKKLEMEWCRKANKHKASQKKEPEYTDCLAFILEEAEAALRSQRRLTPNKSSDSPKPPQEKTASSLAASTSSQAAGADSGAANGQGQGQGKSKKKKGKKRDKAHRFKLPEGSDCILCQQHGKTKSLSWCPEWRKLNVQQRWDKVKGLKLCSSCLLPGHQIAKCEDKNVCGIDGCTLTHRRDLHYKPNSSSNAAAPEQGQK